MGKDKIQLLDQALNAASSSLNLAKQLLSEIEHRRGTPEMPGLVGKYDGMFMVTEAGKKYPVPDNYSAKTKLVYGDKLKMIEGPEGRRFKLLEEVAREEQEAQLAVKDGHFEALGKESSYRLIQGAVRYWSGEEGDKIKILLPKGGKNVPFAGLVEIIGRKPGGVASEPPVTKPAVKREEPKPEAKAPEKPVEKPREPAKKEVPKPKPAPKKEEEKSAPKAPDNRASARLLGSPSEPSKEEKKATAAGEGSAKKPAAPASKPAKPMDEEDLR